MNAARICLVSVILAASASTQLLADEEKVADFLTLIGVREQIELYPELLTAYVQNDANLAVALYDPHVGTEVAEMANRIISETDYFGLVVKLFAKTYRPEKTTVYRKWLRSAEGKKINNMEKESTSVDSIVGAMTYGSVLEQNPPSAERRQIIRDLAFVSGASRDTVVAVASIARGIHDGLSEIVGTSIPLVGAAMTDPGSPDPMDDTDMGLLDETVLTTFFYMYRGASDEELEAYLRVLEHVDTQWVLNALNQVYAAAIRDVSARIGRECAPLFAQASRTLLSRVEDLRYESSIRHGGLFVLSFPADPTKAVQTIPSEAGNIEVTMYSTEYTDIGITLFAAFNEYPGSVLAKRSDVEVLDGAVSGMLAQGRTLADKQEIELSGHPGYAVRITAANGMLTLRSNVFLVGKSLVLVSYYGPTYTADLPAVGRFLSGFQLVD